MYGDTIPHWGSCGNLGVCKICDTNAKCPLFGTKNIRHSLKYRGLRIKRDPRSDARPTGLEMNNIKTIVLY